MVSSIVPRIEQASLSEPGIERGHRMSIVFYRSPLGKVLGKVSE